MGPLGDQYRRRWNRGGISLAPRSIRRGNPGDLAKALSDLPCSEDARLIEHPATKYLVATISRRIAPATLVTILLAGLDIERLAEELARLDVDEVDALLEDQVVAEHLRHGPVTIAIGGFELH